MSTHITESDVKFMNRVADKLANKRDARRLYRIAAKIDAALEACDRDTDTVHMGFLPLRDASDDPIPEEMD
jgi:hypothetical protein